MSCYERKLVHDIVSERGFVSESEGEGRDRHTVITGAAALFHVKHRSEDRMFHVKRGSASA